MLQITHRGGLCSAVVSVLLISGCAASGLSAASSAPVGLPSPSSTGGAQLVKYTGGTSGPADTSLSPVEIGWVNEQGGQLDLSQFTDSADVAVRYINEDLGGVDGHPVKLDSCYITTATDGQKCGSQLANDPRVSIVLTGALADGAQQLYGTLVAKGKTVLVGSAETPADTDTPGVIAYASLDMIVKGQAAFAAQTLKSKSVAVLFTDNPAGQASFTGSLEPILKSHGIAVTGVPIPVGATGPQVQQALLAANGATVDTIILDISNEACAPAYDGIAQDDLKARVIANLGCEDQQMAAHLAQVGVGGDAPEGWYFVNYGADEHISDDGNGMGTYLAAAEKWGPRTFDPGTAYESFQVLLTTVKLMNQIGLAKVTSASMSAALRGFTGPVIMGGDLSCPGKAPDVSVCGKDVGVIQYAAGKWKPIRWGSNLIDTSQY